MVSYFHQIEMLILPARATTKSALCGVLARNVVCRVNPEASLGSSRGLLKVTQKSSLAKLLVEWSSRLLWIVERIPGHVAPYWPWPPALTPTARALLDTLFTSLASGSIDFLGWF